MEGTIKAIRSERINNRKYGFITGEDGLEYYFDSRGIGSAASMDDYHEKEKVEFSVIKQNGKHDVAKNVIKIVDEPIKFYRPGYFRWII